MKFRCPSRIHGIVVEKGRMEVKCGSKRCGAGSGIVVLHYFSTTTGELLETRKFADPAKSVGSKSKSQEVKA